MLDRHQHKLNSLRHQVDYLGMLEDRHVVWASDTNDSETKSKHLEIADMLREVKNQYSALLEMYSKP